MAILVVMPSLSAAQNKDDLRKNAKQTAATLRALGEPLDRCSLDANFGAGPVIVRSHGSGGLQAGDKLLSLDGAPVAGKTPEEVIAILRKKAPTSTTLVSVERDGRATDFSVTCINSRATMEPLLAALDLAARGMFDECVSAIARVPTIDTFTAAIRADCAALSRNIRKPDVAALMVRVAEMAIEDARYVPSARPAVIKQLRIMESTIVQSQGAARFQQIVDSTKQWPGGEDLYKSSTPDWALFRRNAESALRRRLIDPDSARIEWTHGFLLGTWKSFLSKPVQGYWSCGLVNARNRMGGYTGSTAFVVVIDQTGFVKYSEIGQGRDFDPLSASCAKSVRLLPPPPAELTNTVTGSGAAGGSSLADELTKLMNLRDSGALSEAEFQAAKAKLLGGSGN